MTTDKLPPEVRDKAAQAAFEAYWPRREDRWLPVVDAVAEVLAAELRAALVLEERAHARTSGEVARLEAENERLRDDIAHREDEKWFHLDSVTLYSQALRKMARRASVLRREWAHDVRRRVETLNENADLRAQLQATAGVMEKLRAALTEIAEEPDPCSDPNARGWWVGCPVCGARAALGWPATVTTTTPAPPAAAAHDPRCSILQPYGRSQNWCDCPTWKLIDGHAAKAVKEASGE